MLRVLGMILAPIFFLADVDQDRAAVLGLSARFVRRNLDDLFFASATNF
jgi:hypothetical protein